VLDVHDHLDLGKYEKVRRETVEGEEVGPMLPGAAPSRRDNGWAGPGFFGVSDDGSGFVIVLLGKVGIRGMPRH
jgi:hypothetical protein